MTLAEEVKELQDAIKEFKRRFEALESDFVAQVDQLKRQDIVTKQMRRDRKGR